MRDDDRKYCLYVSNRRHFRLPSALGNSIGKPLSFSMRSGWAKFHQVNEHRKPLAMKDEF